MTFFTFFFSWWVFKSFLDPTAFRSANLTALRFTISNTVLIPSSGLETSLSPLLAFLRGIVSPWTGELPGTSTENGGFLLMRGSITAFCNDMIVMKEEELGSNRWK